MSTIAETGPCIVIEHGRLSRIGAPPRRTGRHRHPRRRRRPSGLAWITVSLMVFLVLVWTTVDGIGVGSAPSHTLGSVDFGRVVRSTTPWSIGLGASTYGATVLSSSTQALAEQQLGASMVRIPVAVRDGAVTGGAAGAADVPVSQLVQRYLQWGYRVLVVIDGATDDFAVHPGDARTIIQQLGYDNGVQYSSSNEPDAQGHDIAATITQARMILAEGRSLYPDFRIWGPVWSRYDRHAFQTFAAALGTGLAGIDYHSYAMGEHPVPTADALRATSTLQNQVRRTMGDLRALGVNAAVAVDELNLTWRYDDGTPGGEKRLLSAVDTVWLASACGHIMVAGGSCLPYADQNGPLGMLTQAGQVPRNRPPSTPMPGYWGIAAWTGANLFPHLTGGFLHAHSALAGVEVFAVHNVAGGFNVVVINKNRAPKSTPFVVGLTGVTAGTYVAYGTDPAHPYAAPVASARTRYGSTVSLDLRPMSVITVVLRPH